MKHLINFLFLVILVNIFIFGMTFGLDRELARRDFEKNQKISGCIYKYNCTFYKKLQEKYKNERKNYDN